MMSLRLLLALSFALCWAAVPAQTAFRAGIKVQADRDATQDAAQDAKLDAEPESAEDALDGAKNDEPPAGSPPAEVAPDHGQQARFAAQKGNTKWGKRCGKGYWQPVQSWTGYGTCSACAPGRFQPSDNKDCCSNCSSCGAGKYSGYHAASCSTCPSGKFSIAGVSSCKPCEAGEYSSAGAGSCSTYAGSCNNGTLRPKSQRTAENQCGGCTTGFYLSGVSCLPHVVNCDELGKVQATAPSSTADATCGAEKACTCSGGTPATGTACPKHGMPTCVKCPAGFGMATDHTCEACGKVGDKAPQFNAVNDDSPCGDHKGCAKCMGFTYSSTSGDDCAQCELGMFSAGGFDQCSLHSDVSCDAQGKVETTAESCSADAKCGGDKQCTCQNGEAATSTACPNNGDARCVECNGGYILADDNTCRHKEISDNKGAIYTYSHIGELAAI